MHFGRVKGRRAVEIIPQLQQLIAFHNKVQIYGIRETAVRVCKIIWDKICISIAVISGSLARRRYISRKSRQGSDWDVTLRNIFLNNLDDSITFMFAYSHTSPQREGLPACQKTQG